MSKKDLMRSAKYSLRFLPDKAYMQLYYFLQFKKFMNLKNPQTYNEKLNYLKLHDRNPEYTKLVDKYEVKRLVERKIGRQYIITTLGVWDNFDEIDFDKLPEQFVLKCTHDSEGVVIVKDKEKLDKKTARKKLNKSLKRNFYYIGREYPYKNLKPRIIAEKYMEDKKYGELRDYKFFCFDGEPKYMFIASGRSEDKTTFDYYDMDFNHLNFRQHYPNHSGPLEKPQSFSEMKKLARKLSAGMKHVRVDFYEVNGRPYFGEMTFYHFSGFQPFTSEAVDREWGGGVKNRFGGERKMKVLNILTSRLNYNGICTSLLNYYNNIDPRKIQLDYLVPNIVPENIGKELTRHGNNMIIEMDDHGKKLHQTHPFRYYRELKKIIRKNGYDIVHVHGSSSMMILQLLAAKRAGVKVRIAHSRNTKSNNMLLHELLQPFFKKSYEVAFACGQNAGEWLFGKDADFTIIPNGKDSKLYQYDGKVRQKMRRKYGLEGKVVVGHVGNFNYQKNHEFLMNVFKELCKEKDEYYLVLAGKGELEDRIKQQVRGLGLEDKVKFLGQLPMEEAAEWLNAMDVMVFPSRFEGFPNVLIEWQMNGLPCIISDTITKDVAVTDLVRFISLSAGPEVWAEAVRQVKISDREKNKKKVAEQVKKAGYDIAENAKRLENLYLELDQKYNKGVKR